MSPVQKNEGLKQLNSGTHSKPFEGIAQEAEKVVENTGESLGPWNSAYWDENQEISINNTEVINKRDPRTSSDGIKKAMEKERCF